MKLSSLDLIPRSYIIAAILLALVGLLVFTAKQGYDHGVTVEHGRMADTVAKKDKALTSAASRLRDAAVSLRAASRAISEVNAEADRRQAEAAAESARADAAGRLAAQLERRLRDRSLAYEAAIEAARNARPSCKALLDLDLSELKECGL